ncbi:DUF3293 domain-containing protein [Roseateles koreensis]|uniref:DUF3293 domain-containing protein n=1 Tax=Roseateles koreensis TaxID=2987526 RepID=A0ABT5KW11_9BURK|nr:DUF3293 domain-containing protein [Roseateles koreensis]MDC8787109.1 DUF3293 domain-containing protein [Roseateles koreensis]
MNFESIIEPETRRAYEETEYRVIGESPFVLRIGVASQELATVQVATGVLSSAFVTACNPFGAVLTDEENSRRQVELAQELKTRSLSFIEGVGQHPNNNWPGESSYLVLGLNLEAARTLGHRLEQNAIVWAGDDAVPQLVLLK